MPLFTPPPTPASNYQDPRDYQGDQVKAFLRKIAFLESSNGQNTNHPYMQSGIHKGTSAVGDDGLMPVTAQQIDKQSGNNQLQGMDKYDAQSTLEMDPELTKRLADTMASQLLAKNPSDVAAYKWNQGQYSKPDEEDLSDSPYVKKFRVIAGMNRDDE